jgi:hypothetical protein
MGKEEAWRQYLAILERRGFPGGYKPLSRGKFTKVWNQIKILY